MQPIEINAISEMNSMILELPAIKEASGKEGFGNILNYLLKDIYIDTPEELFQYMKYNLNDKMTEILLANYGIDIKYSKKVNNSIKRILVFYLERLFQSKGSNEAFGLFAEIFENFFSSINFYNISVDKSWKNLTFDDDGNPTYKNGEFILNYKLDPIFINDEENIIHEIDDDIKISNKYLMTLKQYENYSLFPINTNLIYIQFSGGIGAINNMKVFADGIRSYGATFMQQFELEYPTSINGKKSYLNINCSHLELLIKYFQLKELQHRGENIFFEYKKQFFTNLLFEIEYIDAIEDVLHEYKQANYSNRNEMQNLKRKWQTILRHGMKSDGTITSFSSLETLMKDMYKPLIDEFLETLDSDPEKVIDIYMKLFTETITAINTSNLFVQLYTNTIFMQVLTGDVFVENFFQPIFDIFTKYFFPVEMDYLNNFLNKMLIKDKWNSISTDHFVKTTLSTSEFSLATPQRGLDRYQIFFFFENTTILDKARDKFNIFLIKNATDILLNSDKNKINLNKKIKTTRVMLDSNSLKIYKELTDKISYNQVHDFYKIILEIQRVDSIDFEFRRTQSLKMSQKSKIGKISKQMLGLNLISRSSTNQSDIIQTIIIQGNYNNYSIVSNYDRYMYDMLVKYGYHEEFRQFELQQKYTFNKYMHLTTIDDRL